MLVGKTTRPRNVDSPCAAAILYGDWGTSKAYVIGLAFAIAGYSSFWLILAMCLLTALVGVNYIAICRHYPDGGGVYASVRHRSEILSIVGAFLLIADYIVTAAISALSAFQYLGVGHPEIFAAAAIIGIGALNYFGPKHTGGLAFLISVPTAIVVVILGIFCIPHLGTSNPQSEALGRRLFRELEWFCGNRFGAVWGGSDRQRDQRDEAGSRQHRRPPDGVENLNACHSLGHGRSLYLHGTTRPGNARLKRPGDP